MRTAPSWESSQGATLVESALLLVLAIVFALSAVELLWLAFSGLTDQIADASDGTVSATTSTVPVGGGSNNGGTVDLPFVCEDFDPPQSSIPPGTCGIGHGE